MAEIQPKNGIKNCSFLLCCLFLLKELISEFEIKKIKNVEKLMRIDNPILCFLILFSIILRTKIFYDFRNAYFLILTEMIIQFFINKKLIKITAINMSVISIINFMKLFSFIREMNNSDDKKKDIKNKAETKLILESEISKIFLRFLISPILIFDKNMRTRKRSFLKIIFYFISTISMFIIFNLFTGIYFFPNLISFKFTIFNYLKITIYTFIFWILFFILFFKSFCYFLSELSGSTEPIFSDWWNSNSFSEFWQKWNIPTHRWLRRYIFTYFRLKNLPTIASLTTFFISAIFHELIFYQLAKEISGFCFLSIFSQYFMILIENLIPLNNQMFWILFCFIGQPLTILQLGKYFYGCV